MNNITGILWLPYGNLYEETQLENTKMNHDESEFTQRGKEMYDEMYERLSKEIKRLKDKSGETEEDRDMEERYEGFFNWLNIILNSNYTDYRKFGYSNIIECKGFLDEIQYAESLIKSKYNSKCKEIENRIRYSVYNELLPSTKYARDFFLQFMDIWTKKLKIFTERNIYYSGNTFLVHYHINDVKNVYELRKLFNKFLNNTDITCFNRYGFSETIKDCFLDLIIHNQQIHEDDGIWYFKRYYDDTMFTPVAFRIKGTHNWEIRAKIPYFKREKRERG